MKKNCRFCPSVLIFTAALAGLGCLHLGLRSWAGEQAREQAQGPPGTFRVRVRLIPVDVIVTDKDDKPVLDLRQEDFTLLENGRPQVIRHFSLQTRTALPAEPVRNIQLRKVPQLELAPQAARTFLILMGRGRHQTPFRNVDAAVNFVRKELLPQDRVAVFAYNRATDFTTDHEAAAQVLERYRKSHEKIESWMENRFSGLAAVYGSREIPKSYQAEIDKIFSDPSGLAARQVPPGKVADLDTMKKDTQTAANVLLRADITSIPRAGAGEVGTPEEADPFARLEVEGLTDLPFEQYAATNAMTHQDIQNIFTSIEYLRYMDGEKHLLFFTENGLFLPRMEHDKSVAAVANDARVVIDTFQTGGTFLDSTNPYSASDPGGFSRIPNADRWTFGKGTGSRAWALSSLREISRLTGGYSAIQEDVGRALRKVDESTRAEYLLGYYPANDKWEGDYRRIAVRANRPGLKVYFRHGYYARDTLQPYDRVEFLAYSRTSAAAGYASDIRDIPFTVSASQVKLPGVQPAVKVDLQIDASKIAFKTTGSLHTGTLYVSVFYTDSSGKYLGDDWKTMEMNLKEPTYQAALRSGIPYSTSIPLRAERQLLKVVVYDAGSDKIGSVVARVK